MGNAKILERKCTKKRNCNLAIGLRVLHLLLIKSKDSTLTLQWISVNGFVRVHHFRIKSNRISHRRLKIRIQGNRIQRIHINCFIRVHHFRIKSNRISHSLLKIQIQENKTQGIHIKCFIRVHHIRIKSLHISRSLFKIIQRKKI